MNKEWISLHTHTAFSLLDGSCKIPDLVKRAKELGMKSLAITDHGTMYGCVEFYKACIQEGIKPVIGCEIYVAGRSMYAKSHENGNDTHHLVLLVKDEVGYKNLMKIVSEAFINGYYYKPRVDKEFLAKHSEGLIALSACLKGEVSAFLLRGMKSSAKEAAVKYRDIFKEGFYLELQDHEINEQKLVNKGLLDLSLELDIPLVATNDVHYIYKEDSKAHDVLICIQTNRKVNDENRMRYVEGQFYLRSSEEMSEKFSFAEDAISNTVKIAEQCNFDYKFGQSKLPEFDLPKDVDHFDFIKELCQKGLLKKYKTITKEITDRIDYELSVISKMGYVDYYLIVWDFIRFARENGIPTGPGRGSAAGSIVAYLLDITKVDPVKYSLIFERFLNPERISMPDVDSDFCYERREEVIDYVVHKYGKDNVSQIVTFGTMAARACLRDVGRAMDYEYGKVDKVAKMIPFMLNITIDKALELNPDLKAAYENEEDVKALIDVAKILEGLPRHTSTHAAGVVISKEPLVEYVPLQKNEEAIVAQFPMGTLEELGLLKMDFLGLRTLTVLKDTLDLIRKNRGIEISLDDVDFDDREVYKMISDGKTTGVFQLESGGMTSFMKELKPDSLEDIIAGISLFRPGPMSEIPRYIRGKKNKDDVFYETKELEPILSVTYGCMVYQEQVMQIVRDLAGYSMGRSDLVRRAMSKKKHKIMEQERKNFIYGIDDENGNIEVMGCIRNGIKEEAANRLFDQMMDFASYAFPKAHAAAYAVVGYQTAYFMRYYPVEYIAAMLNSVFGDAKKVAEYIRFAKEKGITVLPPDINESFAKFTVDKEAIRFGLSAVKNVGSNLIKGIVEARESKGRFRDYGDFCTKISTNVVNKRAVESLIKAGAFDGFGVFRSRLMKVHDTVLESVNSSKKRNIEGQLNLFADIYKDSSSLMQISYPNLEEYDKKTLYGYEKEVTGLYVTGHPLEDYVGSIESYCNINVSELLSYNEVELKDEIIKYYNVKDGDKVIIGGIITSVSLKYTRNDKQMAFITIEDLTGFVEVIVFPKIYQEEKLKIVEDNVIIVKGKISIKEEEEPKIICDSIDALTLAEKNSKSYYILIKDKSIMNNIKSIISKFADTYKGECSVILCTRIDRKKYELSRDFSLSEESYDKIKDYFGDKNVKLM